MRQTRFPSVYTMEMIRPETDDKIVEAKVDALVSAMTTEEKFSFLGGSGLGTDANAGALAGVPRLGIPVMTMYDGPGGLYYLTDTTNPPQEEMLAATWDEDAAYRYGTVYSKEAKAIGCGMMLSAQVDLQRTPQFSRTKDQMGADSFLAASLADDLVRGMQSEGGIAVLKHYVAYTESMNDDHVSEQALHEHYLLPFEKAVEAGALGIMSSYNKINGTSASANVYTQLEVLRKLWGYKYFTITDWGGNHEFTLNKGTDIEMPMLLGNSCERMESRIRLHEQRRKEGFTPTAPGFGAVPEQTEGLESFSKEEAKQMVDEAVRHILWAYGKAGYLNLVEVDKNGEIGEEPGRTALILPADWQTARMQLETVSEENNQIIQEIAEEGAVLLKNQDQTLPLRKEQSVAVVGLTGLHLASGIGGERSYGTIGQMQSPLAALKEILGDQVEGFVYADLIGGPVPASALYTTPDGREHGALRTYGTAGTMGDATGQQGLMFMVGLVPETQMAPHVIGEEACIDPVISFTTGTIHGKPNKTYRVEGADPGTASAFPAAEHPAYTWKTYLEAPEDGQYDLFFESMGATAKMYIRDIEGKLLDTMTNPSDRQGAQWYESIVPTETGMHIAKTSLELKTGTRVEIEIQAVSCVTQKDMQIALNWITPSQREADRRAAIDAAKKLDTTVIFAYRYNPANMLESYASREEASLRLDPEQEAMILSVAKAAHEAGHKVTVVLNNDAPVVMQAWKEQVDAILMMYFPGQRGGAATARLLTGQVNPGGHLAYTIPLRDEDTLITHDEQAFAAYQMPTDQGPVTTYTEGIHTDYKWFLQQGIEPAYAFGHGLSYTTFAYSDLMAEEAEDKGYDVSFLVTNTGGRTGSDVAQVYLGPAAVPAGLQMSELSLAGFCRVNDLEPGEKRPVRIHVDRRSLCFWDSRKKDLRDKWTLASGLRTVYVGDSSDHLPLSQAVTVK